MDATVISIIKKLQHCRPQTRRVLNVRVPAIECFPC